jgi:hypothetical protein
VNDRKVHRLCQRGVPSHHDDEADRVK